MSSQHKTGRPQTKSMAEIVPIRRRTGDTVFAIAVLAFAVVMLALIGEQTKFVKRLKWTHQPAFWPAISLGGMTLFALLYAAGSLRRGGKVSSPSGLRVELFLWLRAVEFVVWFMVYVFAVPLAGYLLSTVVFCLALTLRMGYRDGKMLSAATAVGIGIVLVFKTFLSVKIPGGAVYEYLPAAVRNFLIVNF